jgi:hypothetical protein
MIAAEQLMEYAVDPVKFIDDQIMVNERGLPFRLYPHQREIFRAAFAFDADGLLAWDTFVYACPKKSGKTTINGALTTWWAFTQEAPNELYVLANDKEQASVRVYRSATRIIQGNPGLRSSVTVADGKRLVLSNGTEVTPLAADFTGSAGSDHGLTSWDELWGYVSERSSRLWEEMTPVPTRRNSIRIITTYAGWENESKLLWELYKAGVDAAEHPDGRGERIHEGLPLYLNRRARLLMYWDNEPRMPWQTPAYYAAQRRTLRPATYARLHENRWVTSESVFITPELWDPCVDSAWRPLLPTRDVRLFVGVDAALKHDSAAVVAVGYVGDRVALALHRIWRPTPEEPLDLEATIEAFLRELHALYALEKILCDPFQLHRSITTLQKAHLRIEELPQTTQNTTAMGQALWDLLSGRNLRLYPAADMREQALNTVALEARRGWRIAKERGSRKIDSIVALSMAALAAIQKGRPIAPATVTSESVRETLGDEVLRDPAPTGGFFSTRRAPLRLERATVGVSSDDGGRSREVWTRRARFWR